MRGISNHKSGDNKENKNPDVAKAKESKFGKQPRRCVWTTRNYQIAKMVQHHTARCTKSNKINADYLPVRLRTQQCATAPMVANHRGETIRQTWRTYGRKAIRTSPPADYSAKQSWMYRR